MRQVLSKALSSEQAQVFLGAFFPERLSGASRNLLSKVLVWKSWEVSVCACFCAKLKSLVSGPGASAGQKKRQSSSSSCLRVGRCVALIVLLPWLDEAFLVSMKVMVGLDIGAREASSPWCATSVAGSGLGVPGRRI